MISKYSIVQYTPNPINGEKINIGVVVFADKEIKIKFLTNWDRVQFFALRDITFLKEFCSEAYKKIPLDLLPDKKQGSIDLIEQRFHKKYKDWINCIEFTNPKTSLKSIEETFKYACKSFLDEKPAHHYINQNYIDWLKSGSAEAEECMRLMDMLMNERATENLGKVGQT